MCQKSRYWLLRVEIKIKGQKERSWEDVEKEVFSEMLLAWSIDRQIEDAEFVKKWAEEVNVGRSFRFVTA